MTAGLRDALLDTEQWTIRFLSAEAEAMTADLSGRELACLVPRQSIDWLDRAGKTLHLTVRAREIRTAAVRPSLVAFDDRAQMRVYEPAEG
jgi:hypothetical protein